jgi:hypothetical protein
MAAQVVKTLPEGDDWIYELNFDGYRALIQRTLQSSSREKVVVCIRLIGSPHEPVSPLEPGGVACRAHLQPLNSRYRSAINHILGAGD